MNQHADLIAKAKQTLRDNDLGGYTIPTKGLYPFQWNWDAGITALGWLSIDEARAWEEMDKLFEGQWDNGMVPHIVFHEPSDQYFPGPEQWGVNHTPPTTSISQPPVLATVARLLFERAKDRQLAADRLAVQLPKLVAYHLWWYRERDPQQSGLVASYHPWESGMDNSPAWDEALARVPEVTRSYQRRDLGHVDSSQRPLKKEYDRFIYLVDFFREQDFDSLKIYANSPYKMQDVGLNAILQRGSDDLIALAEQLGYDDGIAELKQGRDRMAKAFAGLWLGDKHSFVCRDLVADKLVPVTTTGGMLALYGGLASDQQAQEMATLIDSWLERCPYGLSSTHPDEPCFDAKRYWRGPTWLHINWMIAVGLQSYGYTELAGRVRQASLNIIEKTGYWEYYDPNDGSGYGGPNFSWTAAISLFWLLED